MMIMILASGLAIAASSAIGALAMGYGFFGIFLAYMLGGWAGMALGAAPALLRRGNELDVSREALLDEQFLEAERELRNRKPDVKPRKVA